METPPQITFRNMDPSAAVAARIRQKVAWLSRFHDRIIGCHVIVEAPNRTARGARFFQVHIDLTVPGHEIVVGREPSARHNHDDVYVVIRDAFDAAARQLEDAARKRGGRHVKGRPGAENA